MSVLAQATRFLARGRQVVAMAFAAFLMALVFPQQAMAQSVPTITDISPASGPTAGGTTVTITGTNLADVLWVEFDTQIATIVTVSATQITAMTPAHAAGAVDVAVTTPGGSATSAAASPMMRRRLCCRSTM